MRQLVFFISALAVQLLLLSALAPEAGAQSFRPVSVAERQYRASLAAQQTQMLRDWKINLAVDAVNAHAAAQQRRQHIRQQHAAPAQSGGSWPPCSNGVRLFNRLGSVWPGKNGYIAGFCPLSSRIQLADGEHWVEVRP